MPSENQQCSQCPTVFACSAKDSGKACWCQSFPAVLPFVVGQACLCPLCLKQAVAAKLPSYLSSLDHKEAFELAQNYPSNAPLLEGIDYVMDGELMVFQAWFHLKRGYCCGNDCLNCPYPKSE